jgi:hypothetical protein
LFWRGAAKTELAFGVVSGFPHCPAHRRFGLWGLAPLFLVSQYMLLYFTKQRYALCINYNFFVFMGVAMPAFLVPMCAARTNCGLSPLLSHGAGTVRHGLHY